MDLYFSVQAYKMDLHVTIRRAVMNQTVVAVTSSAARYCPALRDIRAHAHSIIIVKDDSSDGGVSSFSITAFLFV